MSDREDYKIYVGNLAYDVTEREVRRHFEKYGDVDEVFIATDRYTRRPRGYCFVTFRDIDDAKDAIHSANNTQFAGREINVHKALPKRSSRYDDRRRRSASPRRRSKSPQRRSRSPPRRSRSPRRRPSNSPPRQSPGSPRRRSASPKGLSPSPKRRSNSPGRRSSSGSPRGKSPSPN
ncbi:probable splicing factor, arginine/serine-rich 4 [Dendronephthya gigantea]|uniref:probable splicing factor, arginine/serine-rich 4 n=1 Tax=Dendronephthya gigantea TaxID=151771 RepID=UPI00106D3A24|nr:probable splicing factor, arginine/serine-rich 4 [Dendronephthya gigantea]